ncbi:MAG: hypothetical protein ACK5QT_08165 [Oligoflexia bacterium]
MASFSEGMGEGMRTHLDEYLTFEKYLTHAILDRVLGIDRHQYNILPLRFVVNYWEFRPTSLVERLDSLVQQGVTEVVSFVPWQQIEADIQHSLSKFLHAAAERSLAVNLIVSPELGLSAPNSGIPRDLLSRSECLAVHADGGTVVSLAAPHAHAIPSLHSSEFQKRFQNYWVRVDHVLGDVQKRGVPGVLDRVSLTLTGSFWKYYRSPRSSSLSAFGGLAGDFSGAVGLQLRSRIEQRFAGPEFCEPTAAAANRWKVKSLELVNRRWFMQDAEDQFRARNSQYFGRRAISLPLSQIELYTPEVDPSMLYSQALAFSGGARADFVRLGKLIDEAASRRSEVEGVAALPWVHWTGEAGFASLLDSEKQFLILKSILLLASQGGGVMVDSEEWFTLSEGFRRRAETLARSLVHGDYRLRQRAFYLNSHLWSSGGAGGADLWDELKLRLGAFSRMIASDDLLRGDEGMDADLLIVDPTVIVTRTRMAHLLTWTRSGRVTALPRSLLYTEAARAELSRVCQGRGVGGSQRMDLHVGVPFELYSMGEGKLVIYDSHALEKAESTESAQQFVHALLGLAAIKNPCATSDSRLEVIALERRGGGRGVFVLNPSSRAVEADLLFPNEVRVGDLGTQLGNTLEDSNESKDVIPSQRFHLAAPPCGVLPLEVMDSEWEDELERRQASRVAEETQGVAFAAASAELSGWEQSTWN